MRISLFAATAFTALVAAGSAQAQNTVKIGVILPYSGQLADPSAQLDNGIKLYMKQHGDTVAGRKIEIVRRDTVRTMIEKLNRDDAPAPAAAPAEPAAAKP